MPVKTQWETLKIAIRGSSIQFALKYKKSNKAKILLLERKLKRLYGELEQGVGLFTDTEDQIRIVKHELKD